MALISNAVTRGSLTEEQLDEDFSADRRSVNIHSTDFDSSTEESEGEIRACGKAAIMMIPHAMKVMTSPHSLVAPSQIATRNR